MSKEKISISEIVDLMAVKHNFSKKQTEEFVRMLLSTVEDVLIDGEAVKIKDFGTFKPQWNEPRKSVDVNTGDEITIPGFYKVVFTPDNELKEQINQPYAHLEPLEAMPPEGLSVEETNPDETIPPLRIFEEQASEIKNILSEISAMSAKKGREEEGYIPKNEYHENEIENSVEELEHSEEDEEITENQKEKKSEGIIEETKQESIPETVSAENTGEISEQNVIPVNHQEEISEKKSENQEFNFHTLTRMENRKQRKKRQKEERAERKRREIQTYFTENKFNIVREVKKRDKLSFPQEFSNEVISEHENPIVSASDVPALKPTTGIVPINLPVEESHQSQPEASEETASHRRKPIPMPSAEGLVSEHKDPIPMPESTKMKLEGEEEEKVTITTSENVISETEKTETIENEKDSIADTHATGSIINDPLTVKETAFTSEETKNHEDIQKEIQRNKILEEKKTDSIDYSFQPAEKSRKGWLWLALVISLLVLGTIIFWQWNNIVKLKNNLLLPKTEQVQEEQVATGIVADTTHLKAKTDTLTQTHNTPDAGIFDKPRKYTQFLATEEIKPGKSLSYFAKQYLKSPEFWVYIYEANREIIKDPNNVPAGTKVNIPEVDARLINVNNPQSIIYARSLGAIYLR